MYQHDRILPEPGESSPPPSLPPSLSVYHRPTRPQPDSDTIRSQYSLLLTCRFATISQAEEQPGFTLVLADILEVEPDVNLKLSCTRHSTAAVDHCPPFCSTATNAPQLSSISRIGSTEPGRDPTSFPPRLTLQMTRSNVSGIGCYPF